MKLIVEHSIEESEQLLNTFENYELDLFDYKAEFSTSEEATCVDIIKMAVKAMLLEGYSIHSIIRALRDVADYEDSEHEKVV